jgi:hypothetical protein
MVQKAASQKTVIVAVPNRAVSMQKLPIVLSLFLSVCLAAIGALALVLSSQNSDSGWSWTPFGAIGILFSLVGIAGVVRQLIILYRRAN